MWWYGILPLQLDQGVYQPCDGGVRVTPEVHGRPQLFLEDWSRVQYSCVRQYGGQIAPLVLLTCVGWGELQHGGHTRSPSEREERSRDMRGRGVDRGVLLLEGEALGELPGRGETGDHGVVGGLGSDDLQLGDLGDEKQGELDGIAVI